ncbi:Uncharacterized protein APZ42_026877 [Daphnia magna]|uniref:Uncharacterized protein n=1 Tax=Daphnia magna TaxID=35525 RepID=A0A164RZU9_9CRUS|nr:Uncharacterized protein APZ42_026877 [Daphnia magna]
MQQHGLLGSVITIKIYKDIFFLLLLLLLAWLLTRITELSCPFSFILKYRSRRDAIARTIR